MCKIKHLFIYLPIICVSHNLNFFGMTNFTTLCDTIFNDSIARYHESDCVDTPMPTPYEAGSLEMLLFHKNWIDTVQWHLEDIIRNPNIDPVEALVIKRRIDASNQDRTDKVEYIDGYFIDKFGKVAGGAGDSSVAVVSLNTETPAWAIDRLSILYLKIYHMRCEAERGDCSREHSDACRAKLNVLIEQRMDLTTSIEELLSDIQSGRKGIKAYKQMKMYNDPALNPVLYAKK